MLIDNSLKKLAYATIYFVKNTKYCYMTKLMKLLYLLDFSHYKQVGKSVTGMDYFAWKRGPVPTKFYEYLNRLESAPDEIKNNLAVIKYEDENKRFEIRPKTKFNEAIFTPRELSLLKNIAFVFKELTAEQISNYSHLRSMPWEKTMKQKGQNAKIDYDLAVDETPESLPLEVVKERQQEIEHGRKLFDSLQ